MKVAKVAQICNRPQTELQSISCRWPGDHQRSCRLLGHLLTPWELVVTRPKLCPECVMEKGFIEAHFDLALMTGCPVHRRSLLSRCPGCMNPLRWFRPGLLECHCGASLRNVSLPVISGAEADLLDIMRRKILGLAAGRDCPSGLPGLHLELMNLQPLLSLVGLLGRRRLVVDNDPDRRSSQRIVTAAASVLADWPNNSFRLLQAIAEGLPTDSSTGVARGRFGAIYRSLLNLRRIMPTEQADFLRIAFLDFLMHHRSPSFVDPKLMKGLRASESERFLSRAAFARRHGIDRRTAARFLENQQVPSNGFRWGNRELKIIDSDAVKLSRTCPGKIYQVRRAAAMIGISIELLKHLKASGDFEVNHQLGTKPGFHELDIEAFVEKLKKLAPAGTAGDLPSVKCISFRIIARGRYGSGEVKAAIVRAILSRQLPVIGNVDGSVGGLLIPHEEFQRLANDEPARASGGTRTPCEAARQLECNPYSIGGLVDLELLKGQQTPRGLRVKEESIAEFKKRYCSISSIAKAIHSSSRGLISFCKKCDIPLVAARMGRRESTQTFVRMEERRKLLCFRFAWRAEGTSGVWEGRITSTSQRLSY